MGTLRDVTGSDFEAEVLQSDKPVLVLFSSEWCPSCKRIAPVAEQLSDDTSDRAKVVHVDVSKDPELATRYSVMSIPTVIAFSGGEEGERSVGYVPGEELLRLLG